MTRCEDKSWIELISKRLIDELSGIRYGSVEVSLKVHDGRVVDVVYVTAKREKRQ